MLKKRKGEIATLLTLGLVILGGVLAIGSSVFLSQQKTTSTKAVSSFEGPDPGCESAAGNYAWGPADVCYIVGGSNRGGYCANKAISSQAPCCAVMPNSNRLCCQGLQGNIANFLNAYPSYIGTFSQKADIYGLSCKDSILSKVTALQVSVPATPVPTQASQGCERVTNPAECMEIDDLDLTQSWFFNASTKLCCPRAPTLPPAATNTPTPANTGTPTATAVPGATAAPAGTAAPVPSKIPTPTMKVEGNCKASGTSIGFGNCSYFEKSGQQDCSNSTPVYNSNGCIVFRVCGGTNCKYDCYENNKKKNCLGADDPNTNYNYIRIINSSTEDIIIEKIVIEMRQPGGNPIRDLGGVTLKPEEIKSIDLDQISGIFVCDMLGISLVKVYLFKPDGTLLMSGSDGCGGGVKILINLK